MVQECCKDYGMILDQSKWSLSRLSCGATQDGQVSFLAKGQSYNFPSEEARRGAEKNSVRIA